MKKILVFLLLITIILSCTSKKTTTFKYNSQKQFDSIAFESKLTIYPSLKDTFFIQSPCDSLGNLKPFSSSYTSPQGNIIIEGKNGYLKASIDLKSVANSSTNKSLVHKTDNNQILQSEIVKYRTDWRLILLLIGSVGINIYFIIRKK